MRTLFICLGLFFLLSPAFAQTERGKASYYSDQLDGNKVASGEVYDKTQLTAAHRTLPFGTVLRVTNLKNNKTCEVRVNDRGPHHKSRVIDLSGAAAVALDMVRDGVVDVEIQVVNGSGGAMGSVPAVPAATPASRSTTPTTPPASAQRNRPEVVVNMASPTAQPSSQPQTGWNANARTRRGVRVPNLVPGEAPAVARSAAPTPNPSTSRSATRRTANPQGTPTTASNNGSLFRFASFRVEPQGYGIQLGAFSNYQNVLDEADQLMRMGVQDLLMQPFQSDGQEMFRMLIGPFESRGAAEAYMQTLAAQGRTGMIVNLTNLR